MSPPVSAHEMDKFPVSFNSICKDQDHVYPVHPLDGAEHQHHIFSIFLQFNGVLDATRIHDSLQRLLEIGDWRKFGGRIRQKAHGNLEVHVPQHFTTARPAFSFAHDTFGTGITQHPMASQLPSPADGLSIKPAPVGPLRSLALGPNFPSTFGDFLDQDVPQLSLKINTFTDATLIILTYPHTVFDAFGYVALVQSLQLVVAGRDSEVPPMLGARSDIIKEITTEFKDANPDESPPNDEPPQESGPPIPPLAERWISLPALVFSKIRTSLENEDSEFFRMYHQFIDPANLLLAWLVRQVAMSEQEPRPVTLYNFLNARSVFKRLSNTEGTYTQNMVFLVDNALTPEEAVGPAGRIALSQYVSMIEQASPQQAASRLAAMYRALEANLDLASIFQNRASLTIHLNNLDGLAKHMIVDFSSVLVSQGANTGSRVNPPGTSVFPYLVKLTGCNAIPTISVRGDGQGDYYWINADLPVRAWQSIEQGLRAVMKESGLE